MNTIEVSNFDEMRLGFRKELTRLISSVNESFDGQKPEINELIASVTNLVKILGGISEALGKIEFNPEFKLPDITIPEIRIPEIRIPDITIPEIKSPDVYVPQANVNVSPEVNIDIRSIIDALEPLKYISDRSNKPIAVRMSDGQKFVKAIQELKQSNERLGVTFAGSSGLSKDDYKSAENELYRSSTATNTKVSVGVTSTSVLASNASRKSAILSNDSDSAIYVSLSSTAVVNEGIRLNAYGGSVTIESYTGAITAISSGAAKNLCVVEI